MKPVMWLGAFLLVCLAPVAASANSVAPMPLEIQLLRADLVAVGRLGTPETCRVRGTLYPCAELATAVVLKGVRTLLARRYLLLNMGIMEEGISPRDVPESALFFLTRVSTFDSDGADAQTEYYSPVRGAHSVLALNNENDARIPSH